MKTMGVVVSFVTILTCLVFVTAGFGQSGQCVVQQIQGSLVTMTCPGQGTRVENMGGTADRYKVGDTVAVPSSARDRVGTDTRPAVDQKAGRR